MQTHRETLNESRDAALSLLRQGNCSATEIARRTGLSRVTIERMKAKLGVRTNRDARAAAQGRTLEERLQQFEALASSLQARLDREREAHQRAARRAEIKDEELRHTRKRDLWSRMFADLAYSIYELLPEQAWHVLLAGDELPVAFKHPHIDAVDRSTVIVLTEMAREALRQTVAVRETMALDDDEMSIDELKGRDRFMRLLRIELFGSEDDSAPVKRRPPRSKH